MIIFIEQPDIPTLYEAADTLSLKLAKQIQPNAIIRLTTDEKHLLDGAKMVGGPTSKGDCELIEVDEGKSYIAVCNENVNIDDLLNISSRARLKIGVVRCSK